MAEQGTLIIAKGKGEPEVFDKVSNEDVRSRLAKGDREAAQRFDAMMRHIELVQREVVSDPDKLIDYFMLQSRRGGADAFLSEQLEDEPEKRHRARIEEFHSIGGAGTVVMYQNINFGGASKTLSVTMPNFGYFPRWGWPPYSSFHDRVSSVKYWGANALFEHSWYRGRVLWLFGSGEIRNLADRNFNDIASSYVGF